VQGDPAAGWRDPCRDGDELATDRRRGRFRQLWLGQAGSGAGELNAITASTSQAAFAGRTAD
jgi:hypothetical protein